MIGATMIRHTFDAGITTADGKTYWAQEAWDDAEEALAYGLEWAASRIRWKAPRARKILVAHTVTDDDYGTTIAFDGEYMVTEIAQD
jgi:hypothetical protein